MHNYDDIINLEHHKSVKHPQMPIEERASIFAPFAALTGYNERINAINEDSLKEEDYYEADN